MKRTVAVLVAALLAAATAVLVPQVATGSPSGAAFKHNVCGPPSAGTARCHAKVVDRDAGGPGRAPTPKADPSPTGLSPAQINAAYGFPWGDDAGKGKTIAIVDAYD